MRLVKNHPEGLTNDRGRLLHADEERSCHCHSLAGSRCSNTELLGITGPRLMGAGS